MEHEEESKFWNKVSEIENDVSEIKANVSSINTAVKAQGHNITSLAQSVSKLRDTVSQSGKTDFNTLAGWATVLLVIIGALGSGFILLPMQKMEKRDDKLETSIKSIHESAMEVVKEVRLEIDSNSEKRHLLILGMLNELEDRFHKHELSPGHGVAIERTERMQEAFDLQFKDISDRMHTTESIIEGQLLENRSAISELRERLSSTETRLDITHESQKCLLATQRKVE